MAVSVEGHLYSAGSAEFGQLGNGATGEHIVTAGKTAFANSNCFVRRTTFCHAPAEKIFSGGNSKEKVVPLDDSDNVRIDSIACGKHHCIAVEMSSNHNADPPRVFSWGCGAYGCLGHGVQADEYFPRMIGALTVAMKGTVAATVNKSIMSVAAGASCSLLQLPNGHVFYWGKHRSVGEATMRPSLVDALANNSHIVRHVDAGAQSVLISTANAVTVAWGQGPHGELGFGMQTKSSSKPNFVPSLDGCRIASMACGYGHAIFVVRNDDDEDKAAVTKLPMLDVDDCQPLIEAAEAKISKRDK
jgi:alpha-tubulin suppressor-like RCC1 family protein